MKVRMIKTGTIEECNSGYAVRLIEQGKAVPVKEKPDPVEAAQDTDKNTKNGKKK